MTGLARTWFEGYTEIFEADFFDLSGDEIYIVELYRHEAYFAASEGAIFRLLARNNGWLVALTVDNSHGDYLCDEVLFGAAGLERVVSLPLLRAHVEFPTPGCSGLRYVLDNGNMQSVIQFIDDDCRPSPYPAIFEWAKKKPTPRYFDFAVPEHSAWTHPTQEEGT